MPQPKDSVVAAVRDGSLPIFPPQRAFVVQFSQESQATRLFDGGRVEHVVSGHSRRFASPEELLTFIAAELATVSRAPDKVEGEHS